MFLYQAAHVGLAVDEELGSGVLLTPQQARALAARLNELAASAGAAR